MTTQTKEESQGACSDSSAEVVAWLNTISGETSRSDAYLESMGLTSNIPLVRQSDYLALQEKVKALEENASEPCKYCDGTGDVHRADGEWVGECKECTTQPTAQAAVAAFKRKAAEVCNRFMKDELYPTDFHLGASYCKQEILAIPTDETALMELLQQVAVEMRNLCEYGLKDVEELWPYGVFGINAAVNRVMKGE